MTNIINILNFPVQLENDIIFATAKQMSEIFECSLRNIEIHIQNIYNTNELDENSTTKDFFVVQKEGTRNVERKVKHYSLDMIIAVGYRVNSVKATKFRVEATKVLKEYLTSSKPQSKKPSIPSLPSTKELALMVIKAEEEKEILQIENLELKERIDDISDTNEELRKNMRARDVLHNAKYDDRGLQACARELGLNPNKFINKLKELGYLRDCKPPLPYQEYIDRGLFVIKAVPVDCYDPNEEVMYQVIKSQAKITKKGYEHFRDLIPSKFIDIATPQINLVLADSAELPSKNRKLAINQ